jgi:hypothetical protein
MSVKVTPAGGLEFTKSMVTLVLSTFMLVTVLVGLAFKAVGASEQLENATPVVRHDSLVRAVATTRRRSKRCAGPDGPELPAGALPEPVLRSGPADGRKVGRQK